MRILHTADVHLDTAYVRHEDSLRQRLQDLGRQAFARVVDLAIAESVDALLVAGDLFDNATLTIATERLLREQLQRLTEIGINVVYATGNHDPGGANYHVGRIDWPQSHFHLLDSNNAITVSIERGGHRRGWVVGAGHETAADTAKLAAAFPVAPGPEPAVAMVHTHVAGVAQAPDHHKYAPAALADFGGKGYAYWALGHIHRRQKLLEDPMVAYSGNLQGRHFGETGAKGVLLVDVSTNLTAKAHFVPVATVRWETVVLDQLSDVRSLSDIVAASELAFAELYNADPDLLPNQEWILRVDLRGPCPMIDTLSSEDARGELGEDLRDRLGILAAEVRDTGLHRPIDLAEHVGQKHVLGVALDLVKRAVEDKHLLHSLLPNDLANADRYPDDETRDQYLRELVTDMDMAVAEVLLRDSES